MTYIIEFTKNQDISVSKKADINSYQIAFTVNSSLFIDDFFIDHNGKVYIINNKNIYYFSKQYILLATNVINYRFVNTSQGCSLFYIQKKETSDSYFLIEKRIEHEIYDDKIICVLDQTYKINIYSNNIILLYSKNNLLIVENGITTKKEMAFEITKIKIMNNIAVMLDSLHNLQLFNMQTKQIEMGFKSLGNTIDFAVCLPENHIAVLTNESIFVIVLETRSIRIKIDLNEVTKCKIKFDNRNTIILFGSEVYEYTINECDPNNEHSTKIANFDCKKLRNIKDGVEYMIVHDLKPENKNLVQDNDNCNCHQTILNMKIEMRRGLFELNERLKQIEKIINNKHSEI
ncbi:hypothetical protein BDAP_001242 [Binucleata daphniae]